MAQVISRDLRVDEADLVAGFFHEHWRPDHIFFRDRQLLLWQFFDNPYAHLYSQGLTFKAAFDSKAMVGVMGYMPFVFNRYGSRKYGCHLSNWWVDPAYRRSPVAMGLLHEMQYRMDFDVCMAGILTPMAERLYELLSWVVVRNMSRLVLPIDQERFLRLLDPTGQKVWERIRLARCSSGPPIKGNGTSEGVVEVSELASFDSLVPLAWDDFYWKQLAPSHMGPARETAFLVWRYQKIPGFKYRGVIAMSAGRVCGLLIFRVEQVKDREEKVIRLVDLVTQASAAVPLIRSLVEEARVQKATMVDFFNTNSMYMAALTSCGFIDARNSTEESYWVPFLFQPLDYERNRLNCAWWIRNMDLHGTAAHDDFGITKGDNEFDRPN